jgi:hypothetical protein
MTEDGLVYYSENPGGDGGTDEELSQAYPQAWASLFKPLTYRIDCDSFDGTRGTGIIALDNDVYFFKESSIFAIYGGDPKSTAKSIVSDHIGGPFPHTIKRVTLKGVGTVIFFMSNEGPYILTTGGRIQPFGEFKIKELWPKLSNELYGDLLTHQKHIINNCFVEYFRDTIWVIYRNYAGIYRVFGYYINQTNDNERGCLELDIAGSVMTTRSPEGASINVSVSYKTIGNIISQWPGNGNTTDIIAGNNAVWDGPANYSGGGFYFPPGIVYVTPMSDIAFLKLPYGANTDIYGSGKFIVEFTFKLPSKDLRTYRDATNYIFAKGLQSVLGAITSTLSIVTIPDAAKSYASGDLQLSISGYVFNFINAWADETSYVLKFTYDNGSCHLYLNGVEKIATEGAINHTLAQDTDHYGYFVNWRYWGCLYMKDIKIFKLL